MNFKHIAFSTVLIGIFSIAQYTHAQPRIRFSPPTPPDPGNPSDRGAGAGSRGCDKTFPGLTALVPAPNANDQWGLTTSDRPTIWFNIPTGIKAGTLVEWKLRNANNKVIHRVVSRLPENNPGVIGISLPPLAVSTYQWDLALYCESSDPNNPGQVDRPLVRKGRIQRVAVSPALSKELAAAKSPLDQAKAYAEYGIWYDALTVLGTQIRTTQDKAISEAWNELLQQQKLNSKASATITPCCTL